MKNDIYRCSICGRIIEVIEDGQGLIVCCGQPMEELVPNSTDGAPEKHIPIVEKSEKGLIVKVGSESHPMTPEHYIMWIEVRYDDTVLRRFLKTDDKPEATFDVAADNATAIAYCNLHGLWSSEK